MERQLDIKIFKSFEQKQFVARHLPSDKKTLELIYCAPREESWTDFFTRPGNEWDPKTFHEKCDGKGPTLIIAKSSAGYLCGGYTSVPWGTGGVSKSDTSAFLFSLTG